MKAVSRSTSAKAIIVFTDIRGFTSWSNYVEVFDNLSEFVKSFTSLVRKRFPGYSVKGLGDGAMIVKEVEETQRFDALLVEVLDAIAHVNEDFKSLSERFAEKIGHKTQLALGWGIVRGPVKPIGTNDYVSSSVNKCARLCNAARPFGVVIDRDDFKERPDHASFLFHPQTKKLDGFSNHVDVWVTTDIFSQFVPRERLRETPEVHVAGMCIDDNFRDAFRIFVAKRNPDREHFGGLYEGCGGQLRNGESFVDGVKRHFKTEFHIEVDVIEKIHCFYAINKANYDYIPGIRFLCIKVTQESGWRSPNHSDVGWLTEEEFRAKPTEDFIPGLKMDYLELLEEFKKLQKNGSPEK